MGRAEHLEFNLKIVNGEHKARRLFAAALNALVGFYLSVICFYSSALLCLAVLLA
jgi:hypothetical protein